MRRYLSLLLLSCCTLAACKLCSYTSPQHSASIDIQESKDLNIFAAAYTVDSMDTGCDSLLFDEIWIERAWLREHRSGHFPNVYYDYYQLCFTLKQGTVVDTSFVRYRPEVWIRDTDRRTVVNTTCFGDTYAFTLEELKIPNDITLNIACNVAGNKERTVTFHITGRIHTNNLMGGTIIQRTIDEE